MEKKILVINVGSSSIKFKVFSKLSKKELASGICERIFLDGNFLIKYLDESSNDDKKIKYLQYDSKEKFDSYEVALEYLFNKLSILKIINNLEEVEAIGHRFVHGGNKFDSAVKINEKVQTQIKELIKFAPLHNECQLEVYEILKDKFEKRTHVAVFDTSFHMTIPEINSTYPVPEKWRKDFNVKKYGAHGISYAFIVNKMKKIFKKEKVNLIICHLGNGSSVCAIKDNNSYDTTMGLTPMGGLVMGSRSGDIDPSIHSYISKEVGLSIHEINNALNKESGMKALVGYSDFVEIENKAVDGNEFDFAINLYSKSVSDSIVKYINNLENKIDGLIFTGGIGENSIGIINRITKNIKIKRYRISKIFNPKKLNDFSKVNSLFSKKIYIVKSNEELEILNEVLKLI